MIDVYPSQKIDGKPLELVSQPGEIVRIYVNPDKEAFDEMETPPGCGKRMKVKLYPFEKDRQQNDDEPSSPTENDGEKDTTGKRRKLA